MSKWKGMTILDGDQAEWRVYCRGGGYVAQGEGHLRVLLLGDSWVQLIGQGPPSELIGRIVSTVRRRR
jgi:hypothetical protein